jgi:hypothetical protein
LFLKSPVTRKDWKEFLKKTPGVILVLIIVMLVIRFIITAYFIVCEAVSAIGGG